MDRARNELRPYAAGRANPAASTREQGRDPAGQRQTPECHGRRIRRALSGGAKDYGSGTNYRADAGLSRTPLVKTISGGVACGLLQTTTCMRGKLAAPRDQEPVRYATALLIIDMVNPLDFPGGERLLPAAFVAARRIAAFKRRLRAADVPAIYVNDNFGRWELGFRELVDLYRGSSAPGAALLDHIAPEIGDHFVLKPKHSAFYATSLEVLLVRWGVERLILTGIAGNICVLFTANDAHMRDFDLVVPSDTTASESGADTAWALQQMRRVMKADVRPSKSIRLPNDLVGRRARARRIAD